MFPAGVGRWMLLVVAIIAVGILLRGFAAQGDLWLDEIWSLAMARMAGSPAGVVTVVHSDNNHYLNTLWLMAVGPGAGALAIRGPALLAGLGVMLAALANLLRLARPALAIWLGLLAVSPILVQYSSEARGYAPAAFFALASFAIFSRLLAGRRKTDAALFAGLCCLGLLAHLTFLYVLAALAVWGAVAWTGAADRRGGLVLAGAFMPPFLILALLWLADLRFLVLGGGMEWSVSELLRELLRSTLGLPRGPLELLAIPILAGAGWEVIVLARARRPEWAFFVTVLLLAPFTLLALTRPGFVAPRYFAVAVPFFLFLVALALDRLARQAWGRRLALAVGLLLLAGSAWQDAQLALVGRGGYSAAVEYVMRNSPPGEMTIGSDNEFRNPMLIYFHARQFPGGDEIIYRSPAEAAARPPAWIIRHDFSSDPRPAAEFAGPQGKKYRLAREFPYSGLSGWHWQLYRRTDRD